MVGEGGKGVSKEGAGRREGMGAQVGRVRMLVDRSSLNDDLQRIRYTGLVILGHRGLSPHTGHFVNIPDHGYVMEKQGTTRMP